MRKLLIVCYYELKDYLQTIASSFIEQYSWDIVSYPLYMYCYDKYSKIDDYPEHFSKTIKKEKPDVILWWFTDVSLSLFTKIKKENPDIFYIIYNSNDPLNINKTFFDKCKIFNMVITPCKHNMCGYRTYSGVQDVKFFPMGTDQQIFRKYSEEELINLRQLDEVINTVKSNNKIFTISFICDSLYTDYIKDQLVPRKIIIQTINTLCIKNNWKFNLYGPEFLKQSYASIYCGDPNYLDKPVIFNNSNVNIISHPIKNKFVSVDHNLIQIMSCGGLILMDDTYGLNNHFNKNDQCILFFNSIESIETQLNAIFNMYINNDEKLNEIKQNCIEYSKRYTWDKLVSLIYCSYCKNKFDPNFYSKTYSINIDEILDPQSSYSLTNDTNYNPDDKTKLTELLYNIWLQKYKKGIIEICYPICVPSNFDYHNYKEKYMLDTDNVTLLYIDWWLKGKNTDYITRHTGTSNTLSGMRMNIQTTHLFNLFEAFNFMRSPDYDNKLYGIKKIDSIAKKNPRLNINNALREYIEISFTE
jgi:hypothetical protein